MLDQSWMLEQIRATGRFEERRPQENDTISFGMLNQSYGATIYVMRRREFAIRVNAIPRFPNNDRLQSYCEQHHHRMEGHRNNMRYAYALREQHILPVPANPHPQFCRPHRDHKEV